MLKSFSPRSFNDLLCLVIISLIVALWILLGLQIVQLSAEVTGALIVTWTLLVQYYFRKKSSSPKE